MSIWIVKAALQKTISYLPASDKINYLFQKHVTKGVTLTEALFEDKLIHCGNHFKAFKKYGQLNMSQAIALELGTGWFPIVPIGLYLSGINEVYTIDLVNLLRSENVLITINKFLTYADNGKLQHWLPDIKPERLATLKSLPKNDPSSVLAVLNIKAIVGDARKMQFKSQSIDLIVSNNVFEHIYPFILKDILTEFKRVSKDKAVMSHFIDMSDHFAHMDKSINIYNFLKYSDSMWNIIDNTIQPMNRLRVYDYRKMYAHAGIKVQEEINRPGEPKLLNTLKLHPRYSGYPPEETAISHTTFISVM